MSAGFGGMTFRVFVLLVALAVAAPAQAAICGAFDKPLTQAETARYVGEVKDAYPARYRPTLDRVKITLSAEPVHNLVTVQGRDGDELIIPAGYLKTHCLLTLAVVGYAGSIGGAAGPLDFASMPDCPGIPSRVACLLGVLDAQDKRSEVARDKDAGRFAGFFLLLVESGFQYAIAHEFGHVVNDRLDQRRRRPPDYDAELAADLQALHVIAANKVLPFADSLLFGAQVIVGIVEDGRSAAGPAPHEAPICRASRSNAMREKLVPSVARITGWLHSGNPFAELLKNPDGSIMADFPFPSVAARCPSALPAEVAATEADLKRLEALVVGLPSPTELSDAQRAAILRVEMRSPIGRSVRNAIYGNASLVNILTQGGALTTPNVSARDRDRILAAMNGLEKQLDLTDMSSSNYQEFLLISALGRFAVAPKGSSFVRNAAALDQELDRAAAFGRASVQGQQIYAMGKFMAGDCDRAFAALLQSEDLRSFVLSRGQAILDQYGLKAPEPPKEMAAMIALARKLRDSGQPFPPQACQQLHGLIAAELKTNYGWAD